MVMAMAGFAVNDGFVKSVSGQLSLGQVIMIRGVFAVVFIALLAGALGHFRPWKTALSPLLVWRSVCEVVATLSFLTALFNIPLANASAILQALPLVVTVGAAIFFGEKVGWRRFGAISVGLIGVLVIVRPGTEGFTIYSLSCVVTVIASAIRDMLSKKLPADLPNMFVALITVLVVTFTGAILCLIQPWHPVSGSQIYMLGAASLFVLIGYYFVIAAMRVGEVAIISPFRYSVLLFSILIGYFGFSEVPDFATWVGSAIIVASGIYTLYRERIVTRQNITLPPTR